MEEKKNLSREEILEIIKVFSEKPMFGKVIITLNSEYDEDKDEDALNFSNNVMSEFQYVIAVGENVKQIEPGDLVRVDIEKMTTKEINPNNSHEMLSSIKLSPIVYGDYVFAILEDRLILTKFTNTQTLQTNE
jgi:hypothetical protein